MRHSTALQTSSVIDLLPGVSNCVLKAGSVPEGGIPGADHA